MTYYIEQYVKKISNPIICLYKNKRLSFSNGSEFALFEFDNLVSVEKIMIENNNVLIQVVDKIDSITNEDWIEEHIRMYGHEPNLFDGV